MTLMRDSGTVARRTQHGEAHEGEARHLGRPSSEKQLLARPRRGSGLPAPLRLCAHVKIQVVIYKEMAPELERSPGPPQTRAPSRSAACLPQTRPRTPLPVLRGARACESTCVRSAPLRRAASTLWRNAAFEI